MEQRREIEALSKHCEELQAEIKELKSKLLQREKFIGSYNEAKEIAGEEYVILEISEDHGKRKLSSADIEERIKALQDENKRLTETVDQLEQERREAAARLEKAEKLKEEAENLVVKFKSYKENQERLISELSAQKSNSSKNNNNNGAEVLSYEMKLADKDAEIEIMRNETKINRLELENINRQCKELQVQLKETNDMLTRQEKMFEDAAIEVRDSESRLKAAVEQKMKLEDELVRMEAEYKADLDRVRSLEVSIEDKDIAIDQLTLKLERLNATLQGDEASRKTLKELQSEVERLENGLDVVSQKYDEMKGKYRQAKKDFKETEVDFERKLNESGSVIEERDSRIKQLELEVQLLVEKHDSAMVEHHKSEQEKIGNITMERSKSLTELQIVKDELFQAKSKLDHVHAEYQGRIELAEEERDRLRNLLEQANCNVSEKQEECQLMQDRLSMSMEESQLLSVEQVNRLEELESEMNLLENQLLEQQEQHKSEINDLNENNYKVIHRMQDDIDQKISKWHSELSEKESELMELREEQKFCMSELNDRNNELDDLRKKHKELSLSAVEKERLLKEEVQMLQEQNEMEMMNEIKKIR